MSALRWRTVTGERDSRFLVRGTELATAVVPNCSHRFVLCEHRVVGRDDMGATFDREYRVRDAHGVSDAQVRERVRPPIVARFDTEAEALAWCAAQP